MDRRVRLALTADVRAKVWDGWKAGLSLGDISRALERDFRSLYGVLLEHGGIAPAARSRAAQALSLKEREDISRGMAAGQSIRAIAAHMRRAASTVSREIKRNGGMHTYRASRADSMAWERARRPKPCRLALNEPLRQVVAAKLMQDWSPEQIASWLKLEFSQDDDMRLSAETIYRSLFLQTRGVLKKELVAHLRSGRIMRRARNAPGRGNHGPRVPGALSIRERPAEIEDRAIPGHWEGDLLSGAKNSHIATLVERHSRFTMLVKVAGKDTTNVVAALTRKVRKLPVELRRSLTWDQGREMARHDKFTIATNVKVYICDPRSPWQRGTNENTNGLLRQYFPHGTDLSQFTQAELDRVAIRLNQRPRKTLGFATPAAKLESVLH